MPLSYKKSDGYNTLPAGEYDATIEEVENTRSKSSNDEMQVVSFRVYGPNGDVILKEYIVRKTAFKLRQIAEALGKKSEFDSETFQVDDNLGSNVRVLLEVEDSDQYGEQNRIKKYLPSKLAARPVSKKAPAETVPPDDDIPF